MKDKTRQRTVELLLIEDNPADVRLLQEVLSDEQVHCRLHVARDGGEASSFLQREGSFANAPYPDLILLDLNLPGRSGREVLADIKNNPKLRRIPVIVLTTSDGARDVDDSYDLHANCYITKPLDLFQFSKIVKAIEGFWLDVVTLPGPADAH